MTFLDQIKTEIVKAMKVAGVKIEPTDLELPPDSKLGDFALPCFNFSKVLKKAPNIIAQELANKIKVKGIIGEVKATGPYLNFFLDEDKIATALLKQIAKAGEKYGESNLGKGKKVMVEYSSPNTNKPQHIGHIRNNMLGYSLSLLLEAVGYKVIKANLINDRGIHICKSMLAWQKWGNGETPESSGLKPDHLVGKYYVMFGQELQKEKEGYFKKNKIDFKKLSDPEKRAVEEKFLGQSPLMKETHEMLVKWEKNDHVVRQLWQKMNHWVYQGWAKTYNGLGVTFDKVYYESQTYLRGKKIIEEGLRKRVFYQKPDNSVWVDLTQDGFDQKVLRRADGTAVYMTQDLASAQLKFKDYKLDQSIYVVASEQDYHFKVLFLILKKLGFKKASQCYHLSHGMVSLPGGKIKSREGKTADADDLIKEVVGEAEKITRASLEKRKGKLPEKEIKEVARKVGLAGLKFFVLKFEPAKNIVFQPKESLALEGFTGPYIQYTYTRLAGILRKAQKLKIKPANKKIIVSEPGEWALVMALLKFPATVQSAAQEHNPSLLANYLFDLSQTLASFYEKIPVLQAGGAERPSRLALVSAVQIVIKKGLGLLGVEVMERM
ncbi:MAG: arginine--tRNA ligase [bacterium]